MDYKVLIELLPFLKEIEERGFEVRICPNRVAMANKPSGRVSFSQRELSRKKEIAAAVDEFVKNNIETGGDSDFCPSAEIYERYIEMLGDAASLNRKQLVFFLRENYGDFEDYRPKRFGEDVIHGFYCVRLKKVRKRRRQYD
jgi:hypothetical protein